MMQSSPWPSAISCSSSNTARRSQVAQYAASPQKKGGYEHAQHLLSTLVGLCMLGLAAPTWAVPMTATLFGEVTEIRDPAFALD